MGLFDFLKKAEAPLINGNTEDKKNELALIIEKINGIGKNNNEEYIEKDELLVGNENFSSEENIDYECEHYKQYIQVSIPETAELFLGDELFDTLEDKFQTINGIGKIFQEDRELYLIQRETCKLSEELLNIEIKLIYYKTLLSAISK